MSEETTNPKRRRGIGDITANACRECRKKRAKVSVLDTLIRRSLAELRSVTDSILAGDVLLRKV